MRATALDVTPVPKPRMTRADKWKRRPSVVKYRRFADEIRAQIASAEIPDIAPGGVLRVRFMLPMPKSWSKAKRERMLGQPHTQTPDTDNLVKALLDAAMPKEAGGDAAVWSVQAEKYWAPHGQVVLWTE